MSWSFATHWRSGGRVWTLDNSSLPSVDGKPVVRDSIPFPDANDVPPPSSPLRGEPETDGKVDEEDDEKMVWETLPDYGKKFAARRKRRSEKEKKEKEESDDKPASKKVKVAGSVAGAKAAKPAKPKAAKAAKAAGSATLKKRKADSDDDDDDENALPAEAMVKIETTTRSGRKTSRPQIFSR
ncbi:hypothetical protein D6C77_01817 [Aureobasidium pullulans]|nr:hypothetical protein D6C77_01817 [Aureobasidium pullulans]